MNVKILIVDDDPELVRLIGMVLHLAGYETVVATNGVEALRQVQDEQPHLVILDGIMPIMNGHEVCQRLRNQPETAHLPIMMLSAQMSVDATIEGLESGADEYVSKPVNVDELLARVVALLRRSDVGQAEKVAPATTGKVLGFIGTKGGVGTTTVATNIALALAKQGKRVVAAELSSWGGTFATVLGTAPVLNLSGLLELDAGRIDEAKLVGHVVNAPLGLSALLGPQAASEFKEIEAGQADAIIKGLASWAEYVVLE